MNKHDDKHHHGSGHSHPQGHHPPSRGMKRHHMIMVVGVVLMLLAMVAYIMSMDESILPGGGTEQPVPADAPAE